MTNIYMGAGNLNAGPLAFTEMLCVPHPQLSLHPLIKHFASDGMDNEERPEEQCRRDRSTE